MSASTMSATAATDRPAAATATMSRPRWNWRRTLYHVVLWLVALLFFAPVLWIFLAAFKSTGDLRRLAAAEIPLK